jgi:predicted Zn-dependent protease
MFGENEAKKICNKVLSLCGDNPAEVVLMVSDDALTRFANNTIHQNVSERNADLSLRYFIGKQIGSATTNRLDETALEELVTRARANAEANAEDPDNPGLAEPANYTSLDSFDQPTAEFSPQARARAVSVVCTLTKEVDLNASGAFTTGSGELVVANTQGVFAYHADTHADFQTTVMSDDSSGRAQSSAWRVSEIQAEELGREAIHKAERGREPRKIEPGEYTVILDPYATQDLVSSLNLYGMGAQAYLEGRSWMNDRIGEKLMNEKVSIWDDGQDVNGVPLPFDFEGVPKQRVDLVKDGVAVGLVYDRYTAQKAGVTSTGHSLPAAMRMFGPIAINLFMAPGDTSLPDMIHTTERGLYITRFWYTRLVHPRDCVVTGMTRDGVFMIENGDIAYPVKNLRYTQSYIEKLANIEAVGAETRLLLSDYGRFAMRIPALKISSFEFTSSTV